MRFRGLSVYGRVAVFLLDVGQRLGAAQGRGLVIPLPMTRAEIASYLGLRTETVCRVLSKWNRGGLITLKGPRIVEVQDLADLEILIEESGIRTAV
jgi:CRP/FNR family transcriptional regulator